MTDVLRRNNVQIEGDGDQVLMFAHGFGCDQNSWKFIKSSFTSDYKLVLFDYIGAGNSDLSFYDNARYASLQGYAADIIEICETLQLQQVIFVGHSVSCMIGALASIQNPALFKKLIFIGPSPCYISSPEYNGGFAKETIDTLLQVMDEDYISWAKSIAPQIMSEPDTGVNAQFLTDSFCSIDAAIAKQFARVTFLSDNRNDLSKISVPSLTIQCSVDMIAPVEVGQFIHHQTRGNTLKVIEAKGHCPHISHPALTVEAMRTFL